MAASILVFLQHQGNNTYGALYLRVRRRNFSPALQSRTKTLCGWASLPPETYIDTAPISFQPFSAKSASVQRSVSQSPFHVAVVRPRGAKAERHQSGEISTFAVLAGRFWLIMLAFRHLPGIDGRVSPAGDAAVDKQNVADKTDSLRETDFGDVVHVDSSSFNSERKWAIV